MVLSSKDMSKLKGRSFLIQLVCVSTFWSWSALPFRVIKDVNPLNGLEKCAFYSSKMMQEFYMTACLRSQETVSPFVHIRFSKQMTWSYLKYSFTFIFQVQSRSVWACSPWPRRSTIFLGRGWGSSAPVWPHWVAVALSRLGRVQQSLWSKTPPPLQRRCWDMSLTLPGTCRLALSSPSFYWVSNPNK